MIKFKWYKLKRAPLSQSFPRVTWIFLYLSHECDSFAASIWAGSYVSFFVLFYGVCVAIACLFSRTVFTIRLTSYITRIITFLAGSVSVGCDAAPTKMLRVVFMICIWYKFDVYNWHIVGTRRTRIHKNPPEISVATCLLHSLGCLSAGFWIRPQLRRRYPAITLHGCVRWREWMRA